VEEAFGRDSIDYFEVGGVVTSNCATKINFFVEFGADTSCDISEDSRRIGISCRRCHGKNL
jgi:hypothetical protein